MPRARKIDPFYMVVIDEDQRLFSLLGPMVDDTDLTSRVAARQDAGKHVRCHTFVTTRSREQIVADYERDLRFKHTDERLV